MAKQQYFCEACKRVGSVDYEERADVFSVLQLVYRDHELKSQQCPNNQRIRVRNPELCSDEQWAALIGGSHA